MVRRLMIFAAVALGSMIEFDNVAKEMDGNDPSATSKNEKKGTRPQVGQDAPDFTLKDFDGKDVTISSFEGKQPVFLVFGSYT